MSTYFAAMTDSVDRLERLKVEIDFLFLAFVL